MTTTPLAPAQRTWRLSPDNIRTRRAGAVGASALAAVATWFVAELVPGADLTAPTFDPSTPPADLSVGAIVVSAAFAPLLGWALLAFLERATNHPKALWTTAAITATVASLAGPLTGTGVAVSQRMGLVVLHLIVSAVYVLLMSRTISER